MAADFTSLDLATLSFIAGKSEWVSVLALRCVCKYFRRIDSSLLQAANMISSNPIPFLPHCDKVNFFRTPKPVILQWSTWRKFMSFLPLLSSFSPFSTSPPPPPSLAWWGRMLEGFSASSRVEAFLMGNHSYFPAFKAITERETREAEVIKFDVQRVEDVLITLTCFSIFRDLQEKKRCDVIVRRDTNHGWEALIDGIVEFVTTCLLKGKMRYEWKSLSAESMRVIGEEGGDIAVFVEKGRVHNHLVSCSIEVGYFSNDKNNNNNNNPHHNHHHHGGYENGFTIQLHDKLNKQERVVGGMQYFRGGRNCQ